MGIFDIFAPIKASDENTLESLMFDAEIDIKAAASDGDAPTFTLIANTGTPMQVSTYYHPVVVDLTGAKFAKKKTPVIMDHDTSKRIGFTTEQTIEATRITAKGKAVSASDIAKEFVGDAKAGFPFQVSIGATVQEVERIGEGETVEVNGKKFKGPLTVARKSTIRELSVTVLGADGNTSAKVAAKHVNSGENEMKFAEWLKAKGFPEESKLDAATLKACRAMFEAKIKASSGGDDSQEPPPVPASGNRTGPSGQPPIQAKAPEFDEDAYNKKLAATQKRIDKINDLFASYSDVKKVTLEDGGKEVSISDFKASAIGDGLDPRDVELALIRASRPGPVGPAVHVTPDVEGPVYAEAIACALLRDQMGLKASFKGADGKEYGYEKQFNEKALEASDDRRIRGMSLHQLLDITIQAATGSPFPGRRNSDEFIAAAVDANRTLKASGSGPFSTLTVTNVLENVANKKLLARFQMHPTRWQSIAKTHNLNDFKPAALYRLEENLGYLKVGSTGELKHGTLSDSKRTVQAETYGRIIGLSRQHLRNDDMRAFDQILNGLADGAAWALESEVATMLLSLITGGTFFSASNGNKIDLDLSIPGLTAAEQAFMDQVGAAGQPIMVGSPDRLLVGTQDSVLVAQLNSQSKVVSTTMAGGFENNPHAGKWGSVVWPYLSNTGLRKPDGKAFTGQNANQWLLLANPMMASVVEVGLLDGRAVPFIEQAESSFDTLGIQMRGYHDFGVAQGDPEAGVLSTGTVDPDDEGSS